MAKVFLRNLKLNLRNQLPLNITCCFTAFNPFAALPFKSLQYSYPVLSKFAAVAFLKKILNPKSLLYLCILFAGEHSFDLAKLHQCLYRGEGVNIYMQ